MAGARRPARDHRVRRDRHRDGRALLGRRSRRARAGSSIYISIYIGLTGILSALQPITGQLYGARRYAEIGEEVRQAAVARAAARGARLSPAAFSRTAAARRARLPRCTTAPSTICASCRTAARQPRLPHLQRADQRGRQAAPRDDPADRRAAAQVPAQRVVHLRRVRRAGPRRPRLRFREHADQLGTRADRLHAAREARRVRRSRSFRASAGRSGSARRRS